MSALFIQGRGQIDDPLSTRYSAGYPFEQAMIASSPASPEVLAAVLESAPLGFALLDADGRVRWANEHLAALVACSREDCIGRPFDDLIGSGADALPLEVLSGPLPGDGRESYRMVRSAAAERRAESDHSHAVSMHRADPRVDRRRHSGGRPQGRTVSYNRRFLDLWHIPDELTASGRDADHAGVRARPDAAIRDAFVARVRAALCPPEESSYDEIRFHDGRIFERYSQPQQIDGRAVGRVWSFRDVTERKRAEEALRFSEDKFAKAFQSSPLRVSISTLAEGRFVEVNDTFLRDHGFTPRRGDRPHLARSSGSGPNPTQRRKRSSRRSSREGMVRDYEFAGQLRDGRVQTTSISAEVIDVGGEACLLAVATDITERKDAEEKARRSRAELRALAARLLLVREEERTVIAREIHDELGQALTGLKIDLAWLKRRVEDRPEVAE